MTTIEATAEPVKVGYEGRVNALWPKPMPKLSGPEAITASKRLWRKFTGKKLPWSVVLTSGNRQTWTRIRESGGRRVVLTWVVNPELGWKDLVHSLSHKAHQRLHPDRKPHAALHLWLEEDMTKHVIASGWLDGKLKRPERAARPKPPVQEQRYESVIARIATWESKRRRANTALKKLYRQKAYYERKRLA